MHTRNLSITFHAAASFERIWIDAGTPPWDRDDVRDALQDLVEHFNPRELLRAVAEHAQLLEFVHQSRGVAAVQRIPRPSSTKMNYRIEYVEGTATAGKYVIDDEDRASPRP
jgi:hypothetical protein